MIEEQRNWAGNITYGAVRWHRPETVEQVQEIVARCRKLRAVGSRHSFNSIADSSEDMLSLERLDPAPVIDRDRRSVTVNGGVRYGELCEQLNRAGYALHNMASLPHISVAGACATGTHGSGDRNGNLAAAVSALEIVTASGERVTLSREQDGEKFLGAVVGLGGLGVVTKVTLDISPAFDMRQEVYENLSLAQVEQHFDEITGMAYSVSLFTDWRAPNFNQLWLKRRVSDGEASKPQPELFGARLATRPWHPVGEISAESCTEQRGVRGPWHERLPHFRMSFTPSTGDELQTEYLLPRQNALPALRAIERMSDRIAPLLLISEVRTVAADNLWMSPSYRQPTVALHFTWKPDWPVVSRLLPQIEAELAPLRARPHWGKLFTMAPAQVQALYEKLPDFQELLRAYDPQGKFRNAFLDSYIFGAKMSSA